MARRFLKWALIGAAALVATAAVVVIAAPTFAGWAINLSCPSPPDAPCQARMRSLGHVHATVGSYGQARAWYLRAAEAGDRNAMFHIGWTYEREAVTTLFAVMVNRARHGPHGPLLSGDAATGQLSIEWPFAPENEIGAASAANAIAWYRRSADLGFAPAANNLGEMYAHGLGVERDPAAAYRFHKMAADAGNPAGIANVAIDVGMGRGVARDPEVSRIVTINPADADREDLREPTFERTVVFGQAIDPVMRDKIRISADLGMPVTFGQRPMQPSADVPAFQPVAIPLN